VVQKNLNFGGKENHLKISEDKEPYALHFLLRINIGIEEGL
jgi:hypothetical protein